MPDAAVWSARPPHAGALQRHGGVAVALHWVLGAALLVEFALGWWMLGLPKVPAGLRADWFNLHKGVGIAIGVLFVARLGWRLVARRPAWPPRMPAWQRAVAASIHGSLYACPLALAVTGYLGSSYSPYPIRAFGLELPKLTAESVAAKAWMSDMHLALSWMLAALLVVHSSAALWHLLVARDGVFQRMWPTWRPTR
jgi:cytochrome b561